MGLFTAERIMAYIMMISAALGIRFSVKHSKDKNIIYPKVIVFFGIVLAVFASLLFISGSISGDRMAFVLITASVSVMSVFPIISSHRFTDEFFEETFLSFKTRYYYKDITAYEIVNASAGLNELILYFGDKKTSLFIGTNFSEFFELISNEYRKNHNGEELPKKSEVKENIIETVPESVSESPVLRIAEENEDFKILVGAEVPGYRICLRRKKRNHELVINNCVYAEYIALGEEFEIRVRVDGHEISSGNNGDYYTIDFDGENIGKEKIIFKNFLK